MNSQVPRLAGLVVAIIVLSGLLLQRLIVDLLSQNGKISDRAV
jgi:hypothetical protein